MFLSLQMANPGPGSGAEMKHSNVCSRWAQGSKVGEKRPLLLLLVMHILPAPREVQTCIMQSVICP